MKKNWLISTPFQVAYEYFVNGQVDCIAGEIKIDNEIVGRIAAILCLSPVYP